MHADRATRATRLIVHLENLRYNIEAARKIIGSRARICFSVKANAYGHGAVSISRCAVEAGVDYLGVATVSEGMELRDAGISIPILLFSQALPEEVPDIIMGELTPFISDGDFIEIMEREAERLNKNLEVHLKIDTGMNRNGCHPEEAAFLAKKITSFKRLILSGVATQLSVADSTEPEDMAYTKKQLGKFREALESIKNAGIDPGVTHAANSGALVFHEDSYFDMLRLGIFLYGYSPSTQFLTKPVMEFRSKVVSIITVKKGDSVSYGRTWIADEDTIVGIIPVGYADGLPRLLSNNHTVSIGGKAYPIVGTICMDQCMVNLGLSTTVQRWDDVILFGPDHTSAEDIAKKLKTISYEITSGISKRVPRVYK